MKSGMFLDCEKRSWMLADLDCVGEGPSKVIGYVEKGTMVLALSESRTSNYASGSFIRVLTPDGLVGWALLHNKEEFLGHQRDPTPYFKPTTDVV